MDVVRDLAQKIVKLPSRTLCPSIWYLFGIIYGTASRSARYEIRPRCRPLTGQIPGPFLRPIPAPTTSTGAFRTPNGAGTGCWASCGWQHLHQGLQTDQDCPIHGPFSGSFSLPSPSALLSCVPDIASSPSGLRPLHIQCAMIPGYIPGFCSALVSSSCAVMFVHDRGVVQRHLLLPPLHQSVVQLMKPIQTVVHLVVSFQHPRH